MSVIRIEQPGLMTTLQDLGRPGFQHLGVTPGGAMDRYSAITANYLAGNPADSAVLEITLHGPALHFEAGCWLAITGADLSPEIEGRPVPGWRPVWIPAGSRLRFGYPRLGCRAYLSVCGGFEANPILESRSTDCRGGFGGLGGRPLQKGDVLHSCEGRLPIPEQPNRPHSPSWSVAWHRELPLDAPACLHMIPGPGWDSLPMRERRGLGEGAYCVSPLSDRMGLRLQGPSMHLPAMEEKLSAGVAYGSLQLPPGGQPILLGVDRQTTGGYPILGTVASVDQPRLAQLRPKDAVNFSLITVEEAQGLYRAYAERLRRLRGNLELHWPLNGLKP